MCGQFLHPVITKSNETKIDLQVEFFRVSVWVLKDVPKSKLCSSTVEKEFVHNSKHTFTGAETFLITSEQTGKQQNLMLFDLCELDFLAMYYI